MDLKYLLILFTISLLMDTTDGQVTQCNTDEYRATVMNLEALRAQFKAFQAEATAEMSNLVAVIASMNETIQGLIPPSCKLHVYKRILKL